MTIMESPDNESSDTSQASSFQAISSADKTVHEMHDMMSRPTLIDSGYLLATDSVALYSYNAATQGNMNPNNVPGLRKSFLFPRDIVQKNPVVASKIKQFSYFKADMKIDLKFNSPPEVLGACMLVYIPIVDELDLDYSNLTVQAFTSYPCKIVDFTTDTSASMTVPYINAYDYYNFSQGITSDSTGEPQVYNSPSNFGAVLLITLEPPSSATSGATVSYSAFASFENVELRLPVAEDTGNAPGPYICQSGNGYVQRIPAHDVMCASGSSKDINLSYSTIRPDTSKVMYDGDETSLSYILSRENIIGRIVYGESQSAELNSYLGKVRCFPKRLPMRSVTKQPMQMGTFDYVSNCFGRYTGTVKIGIRILKTKFHYGRIAVVFDPFDKLSEKSETQTLGSILSTNYNMVIDLQEEGGTDGGSNYYSIDVPYMNNVGYSAIGNQSQIPRIKKMFYKSTGNEDKIVAQQECYNPYLRFYAITRLCSLGAAANTIPMFVSISAGKDYELSIPTVNVYNSKAPKNTDNTFYCQSSLTLIPNDSGVEANASSCVGEKITNFSDIAKRFTSPTTYFNTKQSYMMYELGRTLDTVEILDKQTIPEGVVLSLHINTPDGFRMSNYEAVANLYRFSYGGRRYKFMGSESSIMMTRLIHDPIAYPAVVAGTINDNPRIPSELTADLTLGARYCAPCSTSAVGISGELIVESDINNIMEVERPFYSNRKLISTRSPSNVKVSTDDVLTQFMAIAKEGEGDPLVLQGNRLRMGPSKILNGKGILVSGPRVEQFDDNLSSSNSFIHQPAVLNFSEMEYAYSDTSTNIKTRPLVPGRVLEALGTGAGFCFLQAPPCVIFG